jgi:hypothetical protein
MLTFTQTAPLPSDESRFIVGIVISILAVLIGGEVVAVAVADIEAIW